MEPQKAGRWAEAPLHLYALAQVRASDVTRDLRQHCKDCPGPGVPGGCETRPLKRVVLGRADWPLCPQGMLRVEFWQRIVERYVAGMVSPLTDWPDGYTSPAVRGMIALKVAVRDEDERRLDLQSKRPDGPRWTGRTSAKVV